MEKTIGFWFDYDHTFTFTKVFHRMQIKHPHLRATGFVLNKRYFVYAQEHLKSKKQIVDFYTMLKSCAERSPSTQAKSRFAYYDQKYHLSKVLYSDRHIDKISNNYLKLFTNLIEEYENYVRLNRPVLFIFNCIASAFSHLLYFVLKEWSIQVLIPTPTGVGLRRFIADNPYEEYRDAYCYFQELKNGTRQLDPHLEKEAIQIIQNIRCLRPAYDNPAISKIRRNFSFPTPKRIAQYIKNYTLYYHDDFTQPYPWEKIGSIAAFHIRKRISPHYFNPIDSIDVPYLYFPLHHEPEIATLILAQYHQIAILDILVKQIPLGWKLVVKDHPTMIGKRSPLYYRFIKKRYPNVILLDPTCNAQQLIQNSQAVFSLCGTAIFEAMVMRKPVLYTGKVRYAGFGMGVHTRDILDFSERLAQAMQTPYRESDIIYTTASILATSHLFKFSEPLSSPDTLEDDNIEKIAKIFEGYLPS